MSSLGSCSKIAACAGHPVTTTNPVTAPGGTDTTTWYCVEVTNNTKETGFAAHSGGQGTWDQFSPQLTVAAGGTFCSGNTYIGQWLGLVDSNSALVTPARQFTSNDAVATKGKSSKVNLKQESRLWVILVVLVVAVLVVAGVAIALAAKRKM